MAGVISLRKVVFAFALLIGVVAVDPVVVDAAAGPWVQTAKLKEAVPQPGRLFGISTAIDGTTAVIGAPAAEFGSSAIGAVHVLHLQGSSWVEVQKLQASDAALGDFFGFRVALDGDVLVATGLESGATGKLYVFDKTAAGWQQSAILTPSDGAVGAFFGSSVAMSDETIVVGAGSFAAVTATYVYNRIGGNWVETARLVASDAAPGDAGRHPVDIEGDTIVVGAPHHGGSGAAYVFTRSGARWTEQKVTASNAAPGMQFGFDVAVSPRAIVIGALFTGDIEVGQGAAYVLQNRQGRWVEQTILESPEPEGFQFFGYSVAADADRLVVGQLDELGDPAVAWVFQSARQGSWVVDGELRPRRDPLFDNYASDVAISGNTVLVSAEFDDSVELDSGAVYVFRAETRRR